MLAAPSAQQERLPSAQLVTAPRLVMPGAVDSNIPMAWDLVDGSWELFALVSFAGIPALLSGSALNQMQQAGPVALASHPGHGIWIESIIPDDTGAWAFGRHGVGHGALGAAKGPLDIASTRSAPPARYNPFSGPSQLIEHHSQQASDRDLPAATTRGPRRARLRGGVRAERPVVIWEGHTTNGPSPAV